MSDDDFIRHSAPVNTPRPMTLSPEQSRGWNEWVTTMIQKEIRARERSLLEGTALWVREYVAEKVKALEVEIGQLRADQTIERAHKIIDLPDFRRKKRSA